MDYLDDFEIDDSEIGDAGISEIEPEYESLEDIGADSNEEMEIHSDVEVEEIEFSDDIVFDDESKLSESLSDVPASDSELDIDGVEEFEAPESNQEGNQAAEVEEPVLLETKPGDYEESEPLNDNFENGEIDFSDEAALSDGDELAEEISGLSSDVSISENDTALASDEALTLPQNIEEDNEDVDVEEQILSESDGEIVDEEEELIPIEGIEEEGELQALDATITPRFETEEEVNEYLHTAAERFLDSDTGGQFVESLPEGTELDDIIYSDVHNHKYPTVVANQAMDAGLTAQSIGNVTHRMEELHTLAIESDDVLAGIKVPELRIDYQDADRNARHSELDSVTIRGDQHYIRDLKPINLDRFSETEAGQAWDTWMTENVGADYANQIRNGEMGVFANTSGERMPQDIRQSFRDYQSAHVSEYQAQLSDYRNLYASAMDLPLENVPEPNVRPYYLISPTGTKK